MRRSPRRSKVPVFETQLLISESVQHGYETYILGLAHFQESFQYFGILQLCVTKKSTSTLYWFDDLVGHVTREGEASCIAVDLHSPAKCLLCSRSHARCICIQNKSGGALRKAEESKRTNRLHLI
jgi:hypothetical protein